MHLSIPASSHLGMRHRPSNHSRAEQQDILPAPRARAFHPVMLTEQRSGAPTMGFASPDRASAQAIAPHPAVKPTFYFNEISPSVLHAGQQEARRLMIKACAVLSLAALVLVFGLTHRFSGTVPGADPAPAAQSVVAINLQPAFGVGH